MEHELEILRPRAPRLDEIERSPAHWLQLQDWNAQLTRNLSSNSLTSELYQILGLFFVFEGVVITVVAQATAVKCRNSWIIFALSSMVSVATLFACIQKLKEIAMAKDRDDALVKSIEGLKDQGLNFDLEDGQPKIRIRKSFCNTWLWSYAGAVCFLVLVLSGVTLAAIHVIVCDLKRNK